MVSLSLSFSVLTLSHSLPRYAEIPPMRSLSLSLSHTRSLTISPSHTLSLLLLCPLHVSLSPALCLLTRSVLTRGRRVALAKVMVDRNHHLPQVTVTQVVVDRLWLQTSQGRTVGTHPRASGGAWQPLASSLCLLILLLLLLLSSLELSDTQSL